MFRKKKVEKVVEKSEDSSEPQNLMEVKTQLLTFVNKAYKGESNINSISFLTISFLYR